MHIYIINNGFTNLEQVLPIKKNSIMIHLEIYVYTHSTPSWKCATTEGSHIQPKEEYYPTAFLVNLASLVILVKLTCSLLSLLLWCYDIKVISIS